MTLSPRNSLVESAAQSIKDLRCLPVDQIFEDKKYKESDKKLVKQKNSTRSRASKTVTMEIKTPSSAKKR